MDSHECKTKIYRQEYKKYTYYWQKVKKKTFLKPGRDKKGEKR